MMIPIEELRAACAKHDYEVIERRLQNADGVVYGLMVVTTDGGIFDESVREGEPRAHTEQEAWATLVLRFVSWLAKPTHKGKRRSDPSFGSTHPYREPSRG